jgi:membrane-associated phospholipid phosphatase
LELTQARANALRLWLAVLLATAVATAFCFKHVDLRVLARLAPYSHHIEILGHGLGSAIILTGEALVFVTLAIARVVRGSISPLGKAVAAACISSICAYAINSTVFKPMFGVLPTGYVLTGWPHMAHFFQGSPDSSFPSGHMALAGAFAGVLMRHYPKTLWLFAALLVLGGLLLVAGSWHFVSDVLAGTFFGVSTGLFAAEVWLTHERNRPS